MVSSGAAQNKKIQENRGKIHKNQTSPNEARSAKGNQMENQVNTSSKEISLMDIMDGIVKARGSIGFVADGSKDEQLTSILMLVEESLCVTEQSLRYIMDNGTEEGDA